MKLIDGIEEIGNPLEGEDFSSTQLRSARRGLWIVKSKYGLYQCTNDWPIPYNPSKADLEADDWEIFNPLTESNRQNDI